MHFFYVDESGDTGKDLTNAEQPIMVLGGISVRDDGWRKTIADLRSRVENVLGPLPPDFELHAGQLLSPSGDGPFAGRSRADRNQLAVDLLSLIAERKHGAHYVAIDKAALAATSCGLSLDFNPKRPYLVAFDCLLTHVNQYVKGRLGRSARALLILDEKRQYHADIERIMLRRRFDGPDAHRVKWVTEAGYAVDSKKNPMVQLSDLVVFCVRRFLEVEYGHREAWPDEAKRFHAECYAIIEARLTARTPAMRSEPNLKTLNTYTATVCVKPKTRWRERYALAGASGADA